ncbi:hypothetical protein K435DRAFT_796044 [Dendrothele bispora CBS 962.96]|uniref:Uncharacterized protein n=1 Tax=Dendrothele bispora (strain CBS 962.96) TaxID=1314807 RepID=A0A4S8M6V5_DENBC|nr:hypothetical protein K435DRAFT_796044 [Dendrothele bispora CBS 962.96]
MYFIRLSALVALAVMGISALPTGDNSLSSRSGKYPPFPHVSCHTHWFQTIDAVLEENFKRGDRVSVIERGSSLEDNYKRSEELEENFKRAEESLVENFKRTDDVLEENFKARTNDLEENFRRGSDLEENFKARTNNLEENFKARVNDLEENFKRESNLEENFKRESVPSM